MHVAPDALVVTVLQRTQVVKQCAMRLIVLDPLCLLHLAEEPKLVGGQEHLIVHPLAPSCLLNSGFIYGGLLPFEGFQTCSANESNKFPRDATAQSGESSVGIRSEEGLLSPFGYELTKAPQSFSVRLPIS